MFTHNTKYRDVVILNNVKDLAKTLAKYVAETDSSGKLKFPSSQPTLSYRVGPARDTSFHSV